jgi:hypothetical protein
MTTEPKCCLCDRPADTDKTDEAGNRFCAECIENAHPE